MGSQISYSKILTDETLMETTPHGGDRYPFRFYYDNLAFYDFNLVDWHWHTELEFIYVLTGNVTFWVGEQQFQLSQGNGIFINSKVLHRLYASEEAIIPNFLFMPSFIAPEDSLIYEKNMKPVLSSSLSFQILREEIPWQADILALIRQVLINNSPTIDSARELRNAALIQQIWLILYPQIRCYPAKTSIRTETASQARLQMMMQFIHLNYAQELSLESIARHAMVSKSTALNLFRNYLHITPVNYVISYRLKEAALLLAKTEKKINSIAADTGFHNVDYFCRLFKRYYRLTPTEYRKEKNDL